MVALLSQGRHLMTLSALLIAVSLLVCLLGTHNIGAEIALVASLLAGLVAYWYGARVSFDASLFANLSTEAGLPDLERFDRAMQALGLMPQGKAGRSLGARLLGARYLLVLQTSASAVQIALVLCALAISAW